MSRNKPLKVAEEEQPCLGHVDQVPYMVDTAGWLERTKEKGPASLSIMQTRKNLLRAHVIALVLDGEEVAKTKKSMKHAEIVLARQAVEEGRGLIVTVNKMDLLKGKQKSKLYEDFIKAVPEEIQKLIPQAAQPKVKYFTQVKARPPTFVAFVKGKTVLSDTEIQFLTKSLKEDFDMGGIPIRILQRSLSRHDTTSKSTPAKLSHTGKLVERASSDKRSVKLRL
ncbi:uncharacterized protein LOC110699994 [Chenopodium quinoa]|uniref:uncharacterized protein LOC110699994 n=1 Tax=Chenopodium quinoa TaxID=63459 RepID=UPI000B77DC12|nr:uncharacterized protein LOC110699994 [Chenopodium quinoa]